MITVSDTYYKGNPNDYPDNKDEIVKALEESHDSIKEEIQVVNTTLEFYKKKK